MAVSDIETPAGSPATGIDKSPTGITGLDEITGGGFPTGRPTLVCGAAGCGKTLLAMEFLVRGVLDHDEPGVFVTFEERPEDLAANVRSLGYDLPALIERDKLRIDHVHLVRAEVEETGEYDLEGLFVRIAHAVKSVGAKRIVLDTIESLFANLSATGTLRAELARLFLWLKEQGLTAVITGERGEGTLTRHGLEEYVSDCVVLLDHRVVDKVSTRRLRIVKYRGTSHGTNEYAFMIDREGFSVLPVTAMMIDHGASDRRLSTGIAALDEMVGGEGFYQGSSILVSGTSGSGKSTIGCHMLDAACRRDERCLLFAFEESTSQILRNMRQVGLDLEQWIDQGLLRVHVSRPQLLGMEQHLVQMHRLIDEHQPALVVVDPITSLLNAGAETDAQDATLRLMDIIRRRGATSMFLSLTGGGKVESATDVGMSSLMDAWLLLRTHENAGEHNRTLYVLKARGIAHSNQVREFQITSRGVDLVDVYVGSEGVMTGSARLAQEARNAAANTRLAAQIEARQRALQRSRTVAEAKIAAIRAELDSEQERLSMEMQLAQLEQADLQQLRHKMAVMRGAGVGGNGDPKELDDAAD